MTTKPLWATGMTVDESLRLQAALSQLLGRKVKDSEGVIETVIEAVGTIATRLGALENVTHGQTGLPSE